MAASRRGQARGQEGDERGRLGPRSSRPGSGRARPVLNRAARLDPMTDMRPAVSDLNKEQLVAWLGKHGEPAYRAKQIRRHATHGTEGGFSELTDLPKFLRDALADSFRWSSVEAGRQGARARAR